MFPPKGFPRLVPGFFSHHKTAVATCTLVGTIVGAGVLALPYALAKGGFLYGSSLVILIGLAFLLLNLFTGEIVLRTKEQHQLTGYAEKYLGKTGKALMALSLIVGIYGALTAYLIGEGEVLKNILGGSQKVYLLLFFLIVSFIICRGVKAAGKMEFLIISSLFLIIFLIGLFSFEQLDFNNFTIFNPSSFFLPYGVILFAFIGTASIPEMQEILGKEKRKLKKALIWGSLLPIVLYLLFSAIVGGLISLEKFEALSPNERIATIALSLYTSPLLGFFANLFAVFSMFTTFLTLGIALREMYQYDYHFSKRTALFLTLVPPLIIALFGLGSFISILGFTGVLVGGLETILIVLAYWKAKKQGDRRPEYSLKVPKIIGFALIFLFALGLLYQIGMNFF